MSSFFIRVDKKGWRLIEQSYLDRKSIQKTVRVNSFVMLGFDKSWSVDRAKDRVREVNQLNKAVRDQESSKLRAEERVKRNQLLNSIWLPDNDVQEFENRLAQNNMGEKEHFEKVLNMWGTAKKLMAEVNADPKFYLEYSQAFYKSFIKYKYSPDYSNKLLSLINKYGRFYCKTRGTFFEDIPSPIAKQRKMIEKAYKQSKRCRDGGSTRLTKESLVVLERQLPKHHYEFMFVSLWLGLRPNEIENPEFTVYEDDGVKILRIWQSKIDEFKHIPLIFPEQIMASELLRPLNRPLNRVIQRITNDKRLTVYSGRKGFESLMASLGRGLAEISSWLGHTSVRTTRRYYENRDKVVMTKA